MAEYLVESISNTNVIIEDNIAQLKEQLISKFKGLIVSKYLEIEFKPLAEIGVLVTGDEAKKQINRKYMYGKAYTINLKDGNDCELFTSMHLNNCFVLFGTSNSLEEQFNTCKVPIAIHADQSEELEGCIEDMVNAIDRLNECYHLADSSISSLQEFVYKA